MTTTNLPLLLRRSSLVALLTLLWIVAGRAQSLLQITSPASGTVVQQGQTISVTFKADSSVSNIALSTEFIGGWAAQTSGPGTFSLTIPSTTPIEQYQVHIVGTAAGQLVVSRPISLVVDTPLSIVGIKTQPGTLQFDKVGDTLSLSVIGTLSDGSSELVTYSSKISFSSNNQDVVTVDGLGNATAVGPGNALINVAAGSTPVGVYVVVPQPLIIFTPAAINFGNVDLNRRKKEVLTLTNKSATKVGVGSVVFSNVSGNPADFSFHRYCGSQLGPGKSCTIAVLFDADAAGTDRANLNIVTSAPDSPLQVAITATGVK